MTRSASDSPINPTADQKPTTGELFENNRPVYIIDGARTPFLKARGRPGPFSPVDLAVQCGASATFATTYASRRF